MYIARAYVLLLLIFSVSALTACSGKPRTVDPLLVKHVESFERRYGVYYPHDIVISDLPSGLSGRCWRGIRNEIEIDTGFALLVDDLTLEETVYHELGHCVFKLGHDDSVMAATACPNSIMNSYSFGHSSCYVSFREYYLNQLEAAWKNSLSKW